MATHTSTPDRLKPEGQQPDADAGKRGPNVGLWVLWLIGVTGLWTLLLVLIHYVTNLMLGR